MSNELYHYGIKGMKWGVRKKRQPATDKELSEYRKKKIAEAKPALAYPKATRAQYATKGYWKNMSKANLRRHYEDERRQTEKDEKREARKRSRQQLINRGRAYVKNLVDGFNEGVAAELANQQQQQRQIQQGQQWFMDQQMQFNRQSGSLAVSGGTNPFMFG